MTAFGFAHMNCHQIDWFSVISQPHRAADWIQAAISFTLLWFQAFHALWRTWSYNHQSGASGFEMHTCFQNSKLFFRTGRNLVLPVHREDRQVCINPFAVLRIIGFRLRQLYQMPHTVVHDCYVNSSERIFAAWHNFLFYNLRHRKNIYLICIWNEVDK